MSDVYFAGRPLTRGPDESYLKALASKQARAYSVAPNDEFSMIIIMARFIIIVLALAIEVYGQRTLPPDPTPAKKPESASSAVLKPPEPGPAKKKKEGKGKNKTTQLEETEMSEESEASAKAELIVITDSADANVVVKKEGVTVKEGRAQAGEFRTELASDNYKIEVTAADHSTFAATLQLKPGSKETVHAKLAPPGSIIINLEDDLPDLVVLIDGQKPVSVRQISETDIELEHVPAGAHTVRITHPAIADWEREIDVVSKQKTYKRAVFESATLKLTVRSIPGASIYVDGVFKCEVLGSGKSPVIEIDPGRHTIKVVKDGYDALEQSLIFSNAVNEIELNLVRSM